MTKAWWLDFHPWVPGNIWGLIPPFGFVQLAIRVREVWRRPKRGG